MRAVVLPPLPARRPAGPDSAQLHQPYRVPLRRARPDVIVGPRRRRSIIEDEGRGDDGGRYRGIFADTASPGLYVIVVCAEGSNPAFTRQQTAQVNVLPSGTAFSGAISDYGLDIDGDGRYDQLVIDVQFDVDVAADYQVFGTLTDSAGTTIDQVCPEQQLQPGLQTVSLRFDGARLFDSGLDGPYVLEELLVQDVAEQALFRGGRGAEVQAEQHDPVDLLRGPERHQRGPVREPGAGPDQPASSPVRT